MLASYKPDTQSTKPPPSEAMTSPLTKRTWKRLCAIQGFFLPPLLGMSAVHSCMLVEPTSLSPLVVGEAGESTRPLGCVYGEESETCGVARHFPSG